MPKSHVVHGRAAWGSVPVEAALTLLDLPFEVRDGPAPDNPMAQIPSLILPGGESMTESCAILPWLADSHRASRLAPRPEAPEQAAIPSGPARGERRCA